MSPVDQHHKTLVQTSVAMLAFGIFALVPAQAHVPHDMVADISVSPSFTQDGTVFAIVRHSLFRSSDRGDVWVRVSFGLGRHRLTSLAISPAFGEDQSVFVASDGGGVFRSDDGGITWKHSSKGLKQMSLVRLEVSPRYENDQTILAIDSQGALHRSHDAGVNWNPLSVAPALTITAATWFGKNFLVGTDSGELLISGGDGLQWVQYAQLPRGPRITTIRVLEKDARLRGILLGTTSGLFTAEIGSEKLKFSASRDLAGQHITSLADVNPLGDSLLFATTWNNAVFRSDNGGASWKHYSAGLVKHRQADVYKQAHFRKIAIGNDSPAFLGSFCGVFRSTNLGETWSKLETLGFDQIVGLDVSPKAAEGPVLGLATYVGGMYSSADGGRSWRVNNHGLAHPRVSSLAYSPDYPDDQLVFGATYKHVLRSEDSGTNWSRFKVDGLLPRTGKGVVVPTVFAISPQFSLDQTLYVGMYPHGILHSQNGGEIFSLLWETLHSPVWDLAISPGYARDRTLFASLRHGLFRTRDGGASWERVGSPYGLGSAFLALSPDYENDRTVFIGNHSGLFRSRDSGSTWVKLPLGGSGPETPIGSIAISPFFARDRQILVQVRGGQLLLCRDTSSGFEVVPSGASMAGLEFSQLRGFGVRERAPLLKFSPTFEQDRTVYGASASEVFKSGDGGRTWSKLQRPRRYEAETSLSDWIVSPVVLKGVWRETRGEHYSSKGAIESGASDSALIFRFVGSGVRWLGSEGPDLGAAEFFVDGRPIALVEQFAETERRAKLQGLMGGLPHGAHTLTIRVAGSRKKKSSGQKIVIDAIDVFR